jgi:hypothetical protein
MDRSFITVDPSDRPNQQNPPQKALQPMQMMNMSENTIYRPVDERGHLKEKGFVAMKSKAIPMDR